MANYAPITQEYIDGIRPDVLDFICALYGYRCLSDELAYRFFCKHFWDKDFFLNLLNRLEKEDILQRINFFHDGENASALFLTERGIALIKEAQPEMCDTIRKKAHSLMLLPSKIHHQLSLNTFALQLKREASYNRFDFEYTDRLFFGKFGQHIYPDAVIMLNGQPVFVEADCGTECYAALLKKMQAYYQFLFSMNREFYFKTIKVVFVLDGVVTGDRRRQTITKAFLDSGCCWLQSQIDVWVGTTDELCSALCYGCIGTVKERIALDKAVDALEKHFRWRAERNAPLYPEPDPDDFEDPDLPGYIKKPLFVDAKFSFPIQDGPYAGKSKTMYVDYFSKLHPSVLSPLITEFFSKQFASIYIVIFASERDARNALKIIREHVNPSMPKFYCTTAERLSSRNFYEALFTVDERDRLLHYTNEYLTEVEFERKITKNG